MQPPAKQRVLLVFHLSDRIAAIPVESVERITPMAELARPPGLPSVLEGILNLSGAGIPVLRLDRLFDLPPQSLGLYSMLVILRGASRMAILADRVSQILPVPAGELLAINKADSLNACAEGAVLVRDEIVPVLSPARMLLERERQAFAQFHEMAQRRLQEWEGVSG